MTSQQTKPTFAEAEEKKIGSRFGIKVAVGKRTMAPTKSRDGKPTKSNAHPTKDGNIHLQFDGRRSVMTPRRIGFRSTSVVTVPLSGVQFAMSVALPSSGGRLTRDGAVRAKIGVRPTRGVAIPTRGITALKSSIGVAVPPSGFQLTKGVAVLPSGVRSTRGVVVPPSGIAEDRRPANERRRCSVNQFQGDGECSPHAGEQRQPAAKDRRQINEDQHHSG